MVNKTKESLFAGKTAKRAAWALGALLVLVGLYLSRLESYLLFHSLVEIFSIVIAVGVFVIAWNSRDFLDNNYLLFIGISFLFVGLLDGLHTLAYQGMGVFRGYDADLATQLWICARYMQAASFLIAPFFLGRKMRAWPVMGAYAGVTTLLLLSIFSWDIFPACFVEGVGLTPFKNISEYAISVMLAVSVLLLVRKKKWFDRTVLELLACSLLLTIASELAFTLYSHPYGFPNYLGHVLKVVSFYLIYKAIIETALTRPVDVLFRDLKTREAELQRLNVELDGYARTVSHDLRGPLASIKLASQMLEELAEEQVSDEALSLEIREYAESITRSADKSFALSEDLLALARAGQAPEQAEAVSVDEVLRSVADERSIELERREAMLEVRGELGTVRGSSVQLYQLFSNLVENALVHNTGEGLVITVSRLSDDRPGTHRFLVRDSGEGIPPDIIRQVFAPFFKGPSGGSGLGLAIVHRIVSAYGGEISARNDGGACFEFTIRDFEPGRSG